ncbi:hypothetical protein SCAR479_07213 [Seiridium cardinale]|uniref:C2H2-type domain-containing protein n=1 Tax=Seiridium cardinale TaxID=138064 RepID=A0ABR2XQC6_9PEZI
MATVAWCASQQTTFMDLVFYSRPPSSPAAEYDPRSPFARPDWLALLTDPIDSPSWQQYSIDNNTPFRTPLPHDAVQSAPERSSGPISTTQTPELDTFSLRVYEDRRQQPAQQHAPTTTDASATTTTPTTTTTARTTTSITSTRHEPRYSTTTDAITHLQAGVSPYGHNTPQHVLRETQQQRIARPGLQQAYANLASDENYLISPHATPQLSGFESQSFDGLPGPHSMSMSFDMYNSSMSSMMKKNQESYSDNMTAPQDFELFPSSTMSTPTFMTFGDSPSGAPAWMSEGESSHSRRNSRRISNGIMDRVVKFETLGIDDPQRPLTPPHQNANDYFPMTPMETPHDRTMKHVRQPQRFMDGYDESMEETVKPGRQPGRMKTTFDEMRQAAEAQSSMPSSRRSSIVPMHGSYEAAAPHGTFLDMNQVNAAMTINTHFDGLPVASHPMSASSSFSQHASPNASHMSAFSSPFDMKPELRPPTMAQESSSGNDSGSTEKPSRRGSPHRRTDSMASIASAASIASLDIEQTRTTTGITLDDIHQFIQGPEPHDNKWVCVFEDCNKRFGRKENIKSHVQTHLNDRQYQCPHCQKCFVRQHDLKRHAKIHTGVKPYPCECGNSFARHDALTRHKQRGMCIGAFDGVVRKVVKRGRPRKHRPDMDERKDKSTRTRRKNKSVSSSSSQSGYSDSSAANSPDNIDTEFDMLEDIMDVSMGGTTIRPSSLQEMSSSAPMPSLGANLAASAHSPSATSIHSYVSQLSHMSLHPEPVADVLPSQPASPAKSVASHYNEVPELSQSSSPPSSNRFFDVEASSTQAGLLITTAPSSTSIPALAEIEDAENDLLLQFTHGDPNMLMLSSDSKFEEAFNPVDMYNDTSNSDVYFG